MSAPARRPGSEPVSPPLAAPCVPAAVRLPDPGQLPNVTQWAFSGGGGSQSQRQKAKAGRPSASGSWRARLVSPLRRAALRRRPGRMNMHVGCGCCSSHTASPWSPGGPRASSGRPLKVPPAPQKCTCVKALAAAGTRSQARGTSVGAHWWSQRRAPTAKPSAAAACRRPPTLHALPPPGFWPPAGPSQPCSLRLLPAAAACQPAASAAGLCRSPRRFGTAGRGAAPPLAGRAWCWRRQLPVAMARPPPQMPPT